MVAAISLNGMIANQAGVFSSSAEDQAFLQEKIQESDVLIMGRKTYEMHVTEPKKPMIILTQQIDGIHLDRSAKVPIHFFHEEKQDLIELLNVMQYQTITVLGGAEIYHWAVKNRILTDLYLSIEPQIIAPGKNLLDGELLPANDWKLVDIKPLNTSGTQLAHYRFGS